jgi:hypothetical protein
VFPDLFIALAWRKCSTVTLEAPDTRHGIDIWDRGPFVILACVLHAEVKIIMEPVKLEDNLKLDIPEIDPRHETLTGLINLLHETMLQGADK